MVSLRAAWASANFERLRNAHRRKTWDGPGAEGEPICQHCAVTKSPTRLEVASSKAVPLPVRG
jgi:hypothetical protein